jgi:hypothetical protein
MNHSLFAPVSMRVLFIAAIASFLAAPARAIVVNHIDDFNDGTTQDWRVGTPDVFPLAQPDFGPNGSGDYALWTATSGAGGANPRLVVHNISSDWTGDWTTAGVAKIQLDVQGPSSNSFPLQMRLGVIRNPSGPGGAGNSWVTPAIEIPSDNQWHRITFDVSAEDFISTGSGTIENALAGVAQFRVLHNPEVSFSGADTSFGGGEFFLDNITALGGSTAPTPTGDYSGNGVVDAADYVYWRDSIDQSVGTPGAGADGDESGTIDAGDYTFWRNRFGNTVGGSGQGAGGSVPEPSILLVLITSLLLCGTPARLRRFRH